MENKPNYPIVYVIWIDIVATDANWRDVDSAIQWVDEECGLVHQCGFLLDKGDEYIVIMDSFFVEGDTVGAVTRIPTHNVRFMKTISIDQFKDVNFL